MNHPFPTTPAPAKKPAISNPFGLILATTAALWLGTATAQVKRKSA